MIINNNINGILYHRCRRPAVTRRIEYRLRAANDPVRRFATFNFIRKARYYWRVIE